MIEFIHADAMRALENAAIDSGKTSVSALMERAGTCVLEAVLAKWPDLASGGHAVLLCGPGNNGGDGFVVARLLRQAGWTVTTFFYGTVEKLPEDARLNHARWEACAGGETVMLDFPQVRRKQAKAFQALAYGDPNTSLVIDALFGIGLTRPLEGLRPVLTICQDHYERARKPAMPRHVSIDIPSGLAEDGPLGTGDGGVFQAHLTVTFHSAKTAHQHGLGYCGDLVVKDIGL
ncbi:MAG: NAD(P)H-hydrate epimerase [Pseudomonadota bacterium]